MRRPSTICCRWAAHKGLENTKVGTITGLTWDRSKEALQVEFKPEPLAEIRIGETFWLLPEDSSPPRGR